MSNPLTSPTANAPVTPPWWFAMLLPAMAGGLGWGIRGQYGHETGAMIAGVLVSLTLVLLFCPSAASLPAARAAAWCAVAMGIGGSMTYGQTIGLTQDAPLTGNWSALGWGMLGLAIKGGIWIGFAGAFLGMGLGGKSYRPVEMLILMAALLALFFAGVYLLNTPYDPAQHRLPRIYFSADWRWEPGADLKPRREVWGGLLTAWLALTAYTGGFRRDALARHLAGWGMLAGAIGFPIGQSLQAFHAWNRDAFATGWLATVDPCLNWWNLMETTFGATFGAILGLGLWVNRRRIALLDSSRVSPVPPGIEWLLLAVHLALLVGSEFFTIPIVGLYGELGLLLALIPVVLVTHGRWSPYLVLLPITMIPIAGKSVEHLVYETGAAGPVLGWLVYGVFPVGLAGVAAFVLHQGSVAGESARSFTSTALVLAIWLYFGLNFAFFQFPWPWVPWTVRTPNAMIFLVCALGLTWAAFRWPPRAPLSTLR